MLYHNTVAPATLELLEELSSFHALRAKGFALAGGTSLALQIGHRISVDLDFFTIQEFDLNEILPAMSKYKLDLGLSEKNAFSLAISGIKVDFLHHNYPIIENLVNQEGILLYSVSDIAAMKLNAIINRGSKKDFYDIYYLLAKYSVDELMALYQRKYGFATDMLLLKSLLYFEDADQEPDPNVLDEKITWTGVRENIQAKFTSLL